MPESGYGRHDSPRPAAHGISFIVHNGYIMCMTGKPIHASKVFRTYSVRDGDLNQYGIMHGGRLLTLADEIGYLAAHSHAALPCLTLGVHRTRFHRPVHPGQSLELRAQVVLTGKSSLWTAVDITAADTGGLVMRSVFVYAAVDEQLQPQRVAAAEAHTGEERSMQSQMKKLRRQVLEDA